MPRFNSVTRRAVSTSLRRWRYFFGQQVQAGPQEQLSPEPEGCERASVSCCQGGWRSKGRGRASNHHEPHAPLSLQTSHEAAGFGQHVQSGPQVHLSPGTEQECGNASEKGGRARRGRFMTNRMHSCPCKPCKTLQSTCVGRNSEWESCWEITRVRAQRRMGHPRRIGNTPLEKQRPIVSYG